MTYSVIIRDGGAIGAGVATGLIGGVRMVPIVVPHRGALCVQALPNPFWKPYGAMMLQSGATADDIVRALVPPDPRREERQLLALGTDGSFAGFTGGNCPPYAAHIVGDDFIVGGNILAGPDVLQAMARIAGITTLPVRTRLSLALDLAEGAGGDLRGHSVGLHGGQSRRAGHRQQRASVARPVEHARRQCLRCNHAT